MCFNYELFKENVFKLTTAGEDREMEALLLHQGVFIKYAPDIHVFDEKVSSQDNFQRQRMRWMTAQVQSLLSMLPKIPHAFLHGNINFVDKTIQQALIPRSMLIVLLGMMSVLMSIIAPVWSIKWWALFLILCLSLLIAIPSRLRTGMLWVRLLCFPVLAFKMIKNLFHLDKNNKDFLHTTHGE
jgi:cellulose synthase/poly-beta-1,6-N-acetylglucosamine synthase-like glycosyltransferase